MSGEVQFMFDNLASAAPRIREGRILPLGLTTVSRTPAMPELAPLSELSPRELKGFDISTWYGLFAPAGTPRPIIDRIRGALLEAMKSERFTQTMRTQAAAAAPTTPEAFAQLIRNEAAKYKELVARSGATID
jgi:tripartite-type tricarboxylate transporter receptor subunit TctC